MAYNALNRLKWTRKLKASEIIILHRGGENDRKSIKGGDITEVKKSYFSYRSGSEEATIPMHRILEIHLKDEIIWSRKGSGK